jgi:hypothetical protein
MSRGKAPSVSIEIMGGLGNQLFAFTAGKYVSNHLGANLRVIQRPARKNESIHSSSLATLETNHEIETRISPLEKLGLFTRRLLMGLATKIGLSLDFRRRISRIYISEKIGFDMWLTAAKASYYISGYFQTYVYLHSLRSEGLMPPLKLKAESQWFSRLSQELALANPIVMHVRRGDYLHEANQFIGALSAEYYLGALDLINRQGGESVPKRQIWVFTDSPDYVKNEFLPHLGSDLNVISPPEHSDPAESMVLMSLANTIVISNSTFSWWAAAISEATTVVSPSKWFRNHNDPEKLIPDTWLRAESKWLN